MDDESPMKLVCIALLAVLPAISHGAPPAGIKHPVVTASQINGTWVSRRTTKGVPQFTIENELQILALGKQQLKVGFIGIYGYLDSGGVQMANIGQALGTAKINGNVAVLFPDGERDCKITIVYAHGTLDVSQEGYCGFGANVHATGAYRRMSSRKPEFKNFE